jgi:hypothetical protein
MKIILDGITPYFEAAEGRTSQAVFDGGVVRASRCLAPD